MSHLSATATKFRFQEPRQITRSLAVSIDNTHSEPGLFTLRVGQDGGYITTLSRDDIAALIGALEDPDSWPKQIITPDDAEWEAP